MRTFLFVYLMFLGCISFLAMLSHADKKATWYAIGALVFCAVDAFFAYALHANLI